MPGESTANRVPGATDTQAVRVVSRVLFVLFLVPVASVYPLRMMWADDDELEEYFRTSPLRSVPGIGPDSTLATTLYAVLFVGAALAITYPSDPAIAFSLVHVEYAAMLVVATLTGMEAMFRLRSRGIERELGWRTGAGVAVSIGVAVLWVLLLPLQWEAPVLALATHPDNSAVPALATFLGVTVGNGYIIKSAEIEQDRKRADDDDVDSESLVRTSRRQGSEVSDSKGQEIVERLAERWVVPDELPTKANVKKTREIETYRDIVRVLAVESSRYEKTVPETRFSDEKSNHRSDYQNRRNVAPSGFSSATYTFYVPGSKETEPCDNCRGRGRIDCSTCGTTGSVTCSSCGGSGRTECGNCRGGGRVTVEETCGVCRGSGKRQSGWECDNCGGYGTIETRKACPNCRGGEVDCSSCSGRGRVTCSSCGGRGEHDCGKCDACGRLASYRYVERSYTSDESVSYRTNTVPTSVIEDADGDLFDRETDNNPSTKGVYRRQEETREIPVVSAIYEYLGDEWEAFEVEGSVTALDYPRDFGKQFRIVQALALICVPALVSLLRF